MGIATVVCSYEQELLVIVSMILVKSFAYYTRSENDSLTPWCRARHLVDQVQIVLAWDISNVNRTPTHTSSCCMKSGIIVHCLEHVPIWDDVQMLREQRIMCIAENMPRVTGWDFGEEVVRISD